MSREIKGTSREAASPLPDADDAARRRMIYIGERVKEIAAEKDALLAERATLQATFRFAH